MTNSKRIISLLLTVIMVISVFAVIPVSANAAQADTASTGAKSGKTGDCTWSLNGTELTISGNGRTGDYYLTIIPPWGTDITKVTIKNGVTHIGDFAFLFCAKLKSVNIGKSVTNFGRHTFYECKAITSIKVSDGNSVYDSRNNCNAIIETKSNTLIYGCQGTVIPNSVKSIDSRAFSGCEGLTSIVIPNSVKSIDSNAFSYCEGLTSVIIGSSVKSIGDGAFDGCNALKSVAIPKSVTYIGDQAFGYYYDDSDYQKTPGFTVKGYKGTAAATYAKDNGFTFVSLDKISTPKISKVENVVGGVKVTIGKVNGAVKYRYFRKTGSGKWQKLGDSAKTTWTDKTAKSGTKYAYTARCMTKDGENYISDYNKTGKSITYIAAPAAPTLKNTKAGVSISWKKSAGAVKYRVFRKVGNGKWAKLGDTAKLSFVDKTAKSGKTYTYTIRCISKDGKSYTSAYNTKGKSIKCKK